MSLRYLSKPEYLEPAAYEKSVERMLQLLKKEKAIKSVYRMGNVNHPGISDLDLMVVFHDGEKCTLNPSDSYTESDRYIFTHSLAGASESFFQKMAAYTFWDNLQCVWGEEITGLESFNAEEINLIKQQTALEYLFKSYLELSIQLSYGVMKLRSILQELKAVRYDLAFLNISEGKLYNLTQELLFKLDKWFVKEFNPTEFESWLRNYLDELEGELKQLAQQGKKLWLPQREDYKYGKNVFLMAGDQLSCKRKGPSLPALLLSQTKKIYNANLRLNSFYGEIPLTNKEDGNLYTDRLINFQAYKVHNKKHFPHFEAMFSSFANQLV
jgi:hypothetical protein